MGGSPYKLANKESGHSFKCSAFNYKRAIMYAYSNTLPTNSLEYWTNDNVHAMELQALEAYVCDSKKNEGGIRSRCTI